MSGPSGLSCLGLTRTFPPDGRGIRALDLEVPFGESFALLGANGAGKTTLLNLCLGFLAPEEGRIRIAGFSLSTDPASARRAMAFVPEVTRLYGHLTALEHMEFFAGLLGRREDRSACEALLRSLSFPEGAADQPVGTYSKGMRQKVSLAIGLQKGARVFLLDEPTSGLDPRSTADLAGILRRFAEEGMSILFTTHHLGTIQAAADRVGVLKDGRLAFESKASLFSEADLTGVYDA